MLALARPTLALACLGLPAGAQFGAKQVIDSEATVMHNSVHSADFDFDGDEDVLAAEYQGDEVVWYANLDGAGGFGSPQVLSSTSDTAHGVYATDLDGDGGADALAASAGDHTIAWLENQDGAGGFGAERVITTAAPGRARCTPATSTSCRRAGATRSSACPSCAATRTSTASGPSARPTRSRRPPAGSSRASAPPRWTRTATST